MQSETPIATFSTIAFDPATKDLGFARQKAASEIQPNSDTLHYALAQRSAQAGHPLQALAALREAIRLDPNLARQAAVDPLALCRLAGSHTDKNPSTAAATLGHSERAVPLHRISKPYDSMAVAVDHMSGCCRANPSAPPAFRNGSVR